MDDANREEFHQPSLHTNLSSFGAILSTHSFVLRRVSPTGNISRPIFRREGSVLQLFTILLLNCLILPMICWQQTSARGCDEPCVALIFGRKQHTRRIEELASMPRQSLDSFWWPLAQHGQTERKKAIQVNKIVVSPASAESPASGGRKRSDTPCLPRPHIYRL